MHKLLLIDDSEITLAALKQMLEMAGFEVRAVSSLQKFLNAVIDWKPNVIVTDLYMPEMSGADLTKWLRTQERTARTPIVLCSSAPDTKLAEIAKEIGADAYVSKQDGIEHLPAKLHSLCEEILF